MSAIIDYLSPASISLDLLPTDKAQAMESLIDLIEASGAITDRAVYTKSLWDREAQYVTGLGDQIAIPHGKSGSISHPALAFARSTQGVDWNSPDGEPVKLLFMIAAPAADAGTEHLVILANLARALVKQSLREALLNAGTKEEIIGILGEATR